MSIEPDHQGGSPLTASLRTRRESAVKDFGDDEHIATLLDQREDLKRRERDGKQAEKDRKVVDDELIRLLGNAPSGVVADGRVFQVVTTRIAEHARKAIEFRFIKVFGEE
jgi:hypothetical protein